MHTFGNQWLMLGPDQNVLFWPDLFTQWGSALLAVFYFYMIKKTIFFINAGSDVVCSDLVNNIHTFCDLWRL